MKDALNAFFASISGSDSVLAKHSDAVALFGFFLSEIAAEPITPSNITACYQAARLRAPKNVSDTMSKSGAFVKDKSGWTLQRDALARIRRSSPRRLQPPPTAEMRSAGKQ